MATRKRDPNTVDAWAVVIIDPETGEAVESKQADKPLTTKQLQNAVARVRLIIAENADK